VNHPHEVHLQHRVDVIEVLLLEQAPGHQAGVVHNQVDARGQLSKAVDALVDRFTGGQVDRHGAHLLRPRHRRRLELVG